MRVWSLPIDRTNIAGLAILGRTTIHVADVLADPEYDKAIQEGARPWHTVLAVPLMRGGEPIGAIALLRGVVAPFDDHHIELIQTFADQAAIAIENVRLFTETKEGLERQTAIGEVLRSISSSPADAQPVLDVVARNAARYCAAEDASVILMKDGLLEVVAHHGPIDAALPSWPADRTTVSGRAYVERSAIHVPDLWSEGDQYTFGSDVARRLGHRTTLASPLLREGRALGVILLRRLEVRPFTDRQIELVRTFADQAAIAIENVRLFNETKEALEQQTATAEVLQVISRSAFDLHAVFEAMVGRAVAICAADWGSIQQLDGDALVPVVQMGGTDEWRALNAQKRYTPDRDPVNGRVLLEK